VRFAAHVRRGTEATRGVVKECRERGADGAQIFISNPRAWAGPTIDDAAATAFRDAWHASGLAPLAAHAPYVLNIASANPAFLERARQLASATALTCDRMGVDLLVLHSGAGGTEGDPREARARAAQTLRRTAADAEAVRIVVELMAGTSGAVASTIAEAEALLEEVGNDHVGLCLDTCHLFAAGYSLDTADGVAELFAELASRGITERVQLVHANDSMYPSGQHRDRHANIGEGLIGIGGFRAILARPEAAGWTFVLETPGDVKSHAEQIATLRALAPG
jgi:deoxyribonuclease IV